MTATTRAPADAVERTLSAALGEWGVPAGDAQTTASHLVEGTLRGHLGHGVERIFEIQEGFERGTLRPDAATELVRQGPAFAVLDAGHGLGPPAAHEAVARASALARQTGVAVVALLRAGHLGILGPWAEAFAANGQLGLVVSTTSPAVVFPGGTRALLGTNPVACAVPAGDETISIDLSTSEITRGELLHAQATGERLPPGSAVDGHGNPTRDPDAALEGGLLPLGGSHKGGLLSMMFSILAGPLVGGVANHRVTGTRWMDQPPTKADLLAAFDIGQLGEPASFAREVSALLGELAADNRAFHVPGDGARTRRAETLAAGIPVSPRLASMLSAHAGLRT